MTRWENFLAGINIKLDGTNYRLWSTVFKCYVGSYRNKYIFTKDRSIPIIDDWDADNDWVILAMLDNMKEFVAQ